MESVYLTSAYLAPVQYYTKLLHYPKIIIEGHCNYLKQTYRNRCNIAAANGVLPLSIPIEKTDLVKTGTKNIRISAHDNWQKAHWKSIESAYNSTPFFDYYKDDLLPFYEKKWKFLFDFNNEIQAIVIHLLDIESSIIDSQEYRKKLSTNELDYREIIHPKKSYENTDEHFTPIPYYQVFQEKFGFLPNLSIIDLLFNMGPESRLILQKSFT
jgi:hypothetical protein